MPFHFLAQVAFLVANAAAAPRKPLSGDSNPTSVLSDTEIQAFNPFIHFSASAYCPPNATLDWSCGSNCDANPNFVTVSSGGDGSSNQFWYVGYEPSLESIVVAHQGTNRHMIAADLTDLDILKDPLDPVLFPGLPSSIEVHSGFMEAHQRSAPDVLRAVQTALDKFGTKKVTLTGHSLGGALALLNSVYLPLHLPTNTTFSTIAFGLPRVGNEDFAQYINEHTALIHVTNRGDPIPIVPPMFLGYVHPDGEVHINDLGSWVRCPGHDNESKNCSVGAVPSILSGTPSFHGGPYNGVQIRCRAS